MEGQRGFSLVEAAVALAVAVLIAVSATALYMGSGQGVSQTRNAASQALRSLFEQLRELSSATYVFPVSSGCVDGFCGTDGFFALIRTSPTVGQEVTYQVNYLQREDGLYRIVTGSTPQRVFPGRVSFEFYDERGGRIHPGSTSSGARVARLVARVAQDAEAAFTITLPVGGGGQDAAYSRELPPADSLRIGVVVLSGPWDGTEATANFWGDLYTPVNIRDFSQGFTHLRGKFGHYWRCSPGRGEIGGGYDPLEAYDCTRLIMPDGYSSVIVFGEFFPYIIPFEGYVVIYHRNPPHHLASFTIVQVGSPAYVRECREPSPLAPGEILLSAAVVRKLLVNWGYPFPLYTGPLNRRPGPWQILTWPHNAYPPGDLEYAWAMVPDSMRPGAQNWSYLPLGGYCPREERP